VADGPTELRVDVLGELSVTHEGERLKLPQSRKTRALLAYLALNPKPHRRARLSGLLWDVADDPRGALRWSLSKLRRVVDVGEKKRLVSDREVAGFEPGSLTLDFEEVKSAADGLPDTPTETLERAAAAFRGELLEGLDLDDFFDYEAWLVAEREQARKLRVTITRALIGRHASDPERALPHARSLVVAEPLDDAGRVQLVELLVAAGRRREAEKHVESGERLARELGRPNPVALRAALTSAPAPKIPDPDPEPDLDPGRVSTLHLEAPIVKSTIHGLALFGRERELRELAVSFDEAAASKSQRAILLTGEPGIGKSRLLVELMTEARKRRGYIIEGAAFEVERDRPFGPWVDAFRRLPRKHVASAGLAAFGSSGEGGLDRGQLFEKVTQFLAARADAHPPLFLAFDDFQWFDEASASLLHYVVRNTRKSPIAIVLVARSGELVDNPDSLQTVRGLRRKRLISPYELGALSATSIDMLVRPLGPHMDPARIHAESGGNPLFALELARSGPRPDDIATTLGQLVRDRVDRLPAAAEAVLRWAAVLGTTFSVQLLSQLTSDPEETIDALDALERHALVGGVVDLDNPGGTYQFAHHLVRRVVYADLSLPRRRLMHARVAEVLAEKSADAATAIDLAHHATLGGDTKRAVVACRDAAQRCLDLAAPREAIAHAERGLHLTSALAEPSRTERKAELQALAQRARAAS